MNLRAGIEHYDAQPLPVDDHRAGAAHAHFAADVSTRQAQLMPDEVRQQHTRRNVGLDLHFVYLAPEFHAALLCPACPMQEAVVGDRDRLPL